MGDTDFYGRVGELESLQDAYDSRTAEMAIIYGRRRIGKTALIQKFCEGKSAFFYTAKVRAELAAKQPDNDVAMALVTLLETVIDDFLRKHVRVTA